MNRTTFYHPLLPFKIDMSIVKSSTADRRNKPIPVYNIKRELELNTTEEKRAEFENKLKKTSEKISGKFDFLNKDKEVDSLKAKIKNLEDQISKLKKKSTKITNAKKTTKSKSKTNK